MDAKRELEKIINEIWFDEDGYERKGDYRKGLVESILDCLPGLVEIDKGKILDIISTIYYRVVDYNKLIPIERIRSGDLIEDIAHAICQAHPIRVKEEKK